MAELPDSIVMQMIAPYLEATERQGIALRNLTLQWAVQMVAFTNIVSILAANGALPIEETHKALSLTLVGLPEDDQKGAVGDVLRQLLSALRELPLASPARH